MSRRTGEIIADVIRTHTFEPDSPACTCGARPLDGPPQHIARQVQHAIATRSVPGLTDTKLRILAGEFSYGELQQLASSGVDAFDLLQVDSSEQIEAERAAHNGTIGGGKLS